MNVVIRVLTFFTGVCKCLRICPIVNLTCCWIERVNENEKNLVKLWFSNKRRKFLLNLSPFDFYKIFFYFSKSHKHFCFPFYSHQFYSTQIYTVANPIKFQRKKFATSDNNKKNCNKIKKNNRRNWETIVADRKDNFFSILNRA